MYLRYYYNWHNNHFEDTGIERDEQNRKNGLRLKSFLRLMDLILFVFSPLIRLVAGLLEPLAGKANPVMRFLFPIIAPVYLKFIKRWDAALEPLSNRLVNAIVASDPSIFDA
jgi:hypothetical protein